MLYGLCDTGLQVLAQHQALDLPEGPHDGGQLVEDVHAVAPVLHHPLESADLPLDLL